MTNALQIDKVPRINTHTSKPPWLDWTNIDHSISECHMVSASQTLSKRHQMPSYMNYFTSCYPIRIRNKTWKIALDSDCFLNGIHAGLLGTPVQILINAVI